MELFQIDGPPCLLLPRHNGEGGGDSLSRLVFAAASLCVSVRDWRLGPSWMRLTSWRDNDRLPCMHAYTFHTAFSPGSFLFSFVISCAAPYPLRYAPIGRWPVSLFRDALFVTMSFPLISVASYRNIFRIIPPSSFSRPHPAPRPLSFSQLSSARITARRVTSYHSVRNVRQRSTPRLVRLPHLRRYTCAARWVAYATRRPTHIGQPRAQVLWCMLPFMIAALRWSLRFATRVLWACGREKERHIIAVPFRVRRHMGKPVYPMNPHILPRSTPIKSPWPKRSIFTSPLPPSISLCVSRAPLYLHNGERFVIHWRPHLHGGPVPCAVERVAVTFGNLAYWGRNVAMVSVAIFSSHSFRPITTKNSAPFLPGVTTHMSFLTTSRYLASPTDFFYSPLNPNLQNKKKKRVGGNPFFSFFFLFYFFGFSMVLGIALGVSWRLITVLYWNISKLNLTLTVYPK